MKLATLQKHEYAYDLACTPSSERLLPSGTVVLELADTPCVVMLRSSKARCTICLVDGRLARKCKWTPTKWQS